MQRDKEKEADENTREEVILKYKTYNYLLIYYTVSVACELPSLSSGEQKVLKDELSMLQNICVVIFLMLKISKTTTLHVFNVKIGSLHL